MKRWDLDSCCGGPPRDRHMGRRQLLQGMVALGGGLALSGCRAMGMGQTSASGPRMTGGKMSARWLGGGVMELATPDYKQIAYLDAWVWNNAGWDRFGVKKPAEYATRDGFVQYVKGKNPEAVLVLLTHDHGDHIGDYFEVLQGLSGAGVPVMTVGQSDFMRRGLVEQFKKVNLDPAKVVPNGGNSVNFGGIAKHGAMTVRLVPAVHSTLAGFPAAGFILDIGGVRAYLSGDTDLFGDMKTIGERYQPNVAIPCVGNGPFTMGPQEAARACQWLGVSQAVPVHFAHNALVQGVGAGDEFQRALKEVASGVTTHVMKPGDTRIITT
ncbi:MAG TPA: MBL fold metallo-hydrolase [Methylomirabilota bacterium]|jgi:L-ascorbate metabolism protein UlaG (beta-lactamase superfamily)